jgi:gamma-glutamylcyclotransferase (GGCT)/AIG2-like uncharacterized protein YtfP
MSNQGIYHLFVYGSLRSDFRADAYQYISKYFKFVGPGKVKGRLYDLGAYPAGIPTTDDVFIIGELYVANGKQEFSWAIGQLDDYEGVTTEPGEPQLYRRELTDVIVDNNSVRAWIYWYSADVGNSPIIASGDLAEYLKNK